jgi:hypothetical protein
MQTFLLVLFFGLGMAFVAGASVALYAFLPAALMNGASHNGRYWGLAALEPPRGNTPGNRSATPLGRLQEQSA